MIFELRKLIKYSGIEYADLRDNMVKDQIKAKKVLRVVFRGEFMDLTPKDLVSKKVIITNKSIKSIIYPDQYYRLWSYEWKPFKETKENRDKKLLGY